MKIDALGRTKDKPSRRMLARLACAVIAAMVLAGADAAHASDQATEDIAYAGDLLQLGLPVAALGMTFFMDDEAEPVAGSLAARDALRFDALTITGASPRRDLVVAMVRMEVVTQGLKHGINAERPDGGGQSFPSGHTAAAFTGAEFIRKQYGWGMGTAAYATAAFVGWSRVVSDHHWPRDVYAGAAIGIMSNHNLTRWELPFGDLTIAPSLFQHLDVEAPDDPTRQSLVPAVQFRLEF